MKPVIVKIVIIMVFSLMFSTAMAANSVKKPPYVNNAVFVENIVKVDEIIFNYWKRLINW